jgi:predicted small lipoprotein YifL
MFRTSLLILLTASLAGCGRFGAVYPPRPPSSAGAPVADPTPSRVVAHVSITSGALRAALDEAVPKNGDGDVSFLGGARHYSWQRTSLDVGFSQGRLVLDAHVDVKVDASVLHAQFPLDLHILAEPVVNTQYLVRLQSSDVKVTSSDRRLQLAESFAGVFEAIGAQLSNKLKEFSYDLRPTLAEAYARIAKPIVLPVGDAKACVNLKVLAVEAGPTVVADGLEKDLAIVVAPEVTLPCAENVVAASLPPLSNVATLTPGPFTVTIPIAARYDELTRAMSAAFTDGKLFFSEQYPKLYLEKPEIYESQGMLVLKLHLTGPVHGLGIDADLDGDVYLMGHPRVVDNELTIPDLEPTIETQNFLLSLKAMTSSEKIRDQARAALRLDIGERLAGIKSKLSSDLTFGANGACFAGSVDKIEVVGAYPHGTYLRVYVAVTARASASIPCSDAHPVGAAVSSRLP